MCMFKNLESKHERIPERFSFSSSTLKAICPIQNYLLKWAQNKRKTFYYSISRFVDLYTYIVHYSYTFNTY